MYYRTIKHCKTGVSPYQLIFKREMRTRFDMLKPDVFAKVQKNQNSRIKYRGRRAYNAITFFSFNIKNSIVAKMYIFTFRNFFASCNSIDYVH